MKPPQPPLSAKEVLDRLSVDDVRDRLIELEGESRALRTLLRSLIARENARRKPAKREGTSA